MTEYIEREAAYREICADDTMSGYEKAYCSELIRNIPSADVSPVRHGRWELYGNDDDLAASFFCSLCGWNMDEDEYLDRWSHLNYCPNCGAKMDEVIE